MYIYIYIYIYILNHNLRRYTNWILNFDTEQINESRAADFFLKLYYVTSIMNII